MLRSPVRCKSPRPGVTKSIRPLDAGGISTRHNGSSISQNVKRRLLHSGACLLLSRFFLKKEMKLHASRTFSRNKFLFHLPFRRGHVSATQRASARTLRLVSYIWVSVFWTKNNSWAWVVNSSRFYPRKASFIYPTALLLQGGMTTYYIQYILYIVYTIYSKISLRVARLHDTMSKSMRPVKKNWFSLLLGSAGCRYRPGWAGRAAEVGHRLVYRGAPC